MRLRTRPATIGDAVSVLSRMSDVTKAEMQALGRGAFDTLVAAKTYIRDGDAVCAHTRQPLFVLGLVPHAMVPNLKLTWFIATQEWFDLGAKGVLLGRKIMRDLAARHPGAIIQSVSLSPHPDAPRWFALHGFEEVDRGGNYAVFEFCRKR